MSYRLKTDEPLAVGIKRIALEQINQSLDQLTDMGADQDEVVHDVRKRFKKIRAVLRLVRDALGETVYQNENRCYRDAGRALSEVRDSAVMVETVEGLTAHFDDQLAPGVFDGIRDRLAAYHSQVAGRVLEDGNARQAVAQTVQAARARIPAWPLDDDGFGAVYPGLKRVYKRGRKRMDEAYHAPEPGIFHEWRKRVKYLWYHVRLLQPLWPDLLDELAEEVHELSDYLGDDHDLVALRGFVQTRPDIAGDEQTNAALVALIDRRRAELQAAARPLGERIYLEKPKRFAKRLAGYWDVTYE